MTKKILWGMVNYKTEIYIPYQLKMAYEFNNKDDFNFCIVDNNPIHIPEFWKNLKKDYPELIVIPHDPSGYTRTSGEHGAGLTVILEYARKNGYDYLMLNDPDFFWLQKNILNYFILEVVQRNLVAIGAPYTMPLPFGNNFPVAFGVFHTVKDLEGLDFLTSTDTHELLIGGKDVGYKVRQALCNKNFITFSQSDVPANEFVGGSHQAGMNYSFESILRQYHLYGKKIAVHLHRGSFDAPLGKYSAENWRSDRKKDLDKTPELWVQTREAYCQKYYLELSQSLGMM